jgi:hypothetical protein
MKFAILLFCVGFAACDAKMGSQAQTAGEKNDLRIEIQVLTKEVSENAGINWRQWVFAQNVDGF